MSYGCSRGFVGFICRGAWQLWGDRDGNWVGNTWIKRGELRGFCGQFAGCCCPMRRGSSFPADRVPADPLYVSNSDFVVGRCSVAWQGVISGTCVGFGSIRRALLRLDMTRRGGSLRLNFGKAATCTGTSKCQRKSMSPFSLPIQGGPISIRCSRSATIRIVCCVVEPKWVGAVFIVRLMPSHRCYLRVSQLRSSCS